MANSSSPTLYFSLFIDTHGIFSAFRVVFATKCAFFSFYTTISMLETGVSSSMEHSHAYVSDFGATSTRC
jgi:hypothetical protein